MQLFDVSGKQVKVIMNQALDAGNHVIPVGLNDLTKGIYFVQLVSDNRIWNEKMVVE